jgi:hypothetical protein
VIWHVKETGSVRASQFVNDWTRRCSFAPSVNGRVPAVYEATRRVDVSVRFYVLELVEKSYEYQ